MIPLRRLAARLAARTAVVAAVSALGLAMSGPAAAEPGAFEVTGFQDADFTGASKTWSLPAERPYRYVPFVGEDIGGSVGSVLTGGSVGAVLFERPFFASKDSVCAPDIGSDDRPDLKWLGATATFAGPFGPEAGRAAADPAAGPKGFASLVIFRKELGPPPGALLMDRRRTIGSSCRSPIHKTSYRRLFVPVAEPPERARCFNLSETDRLEESKEKVLNFTAADRLVLMVPGDYNDFYGSVRHRFTASAFDEPGCRGESVSFTSGSSATDVYNLGDFRFRDLARSIRIAYDGGPLEPYLSAPPAPAQVPVAALTPAPAAPAPEAPIIKSAEPAQAAPEPAAKAETGRTEAPAKAEPPEPKRQVQAPPRPAETETATPEPAPPRPAQSESPEAAPTRAAAAQTSGARRPAAVQQAIPKLTPEPLPAPGPAPKSTLLDQTFQYPVHDIYRLNYCLYAGKDCGAPAATAWCKTQGFERASAWQIDENIGGLFPTIVMGERKVCAQFLCDGFQEITCAK